MTRTDWLLVAGFATLLAVVLAVLGVVDGRRASRQLAELENAVCGAPVERDALARLGALIENDEPVRGGRKVAARILGAFPEDTGNEIFYELDGALWTLSPGTRRQPDGASKWPQRVGRWERVAWSEGCRAVREEERLIVARTVKAGPERFAVLVARRQRDLAW